MFKWKVKLHDPPLQLLPYREPELPSRYSALGALPEAAGLPFFSSRRKDMAQGGAPLSNKIETLKDFVKNSVLVF